MPEQRSIYDREFFDAIRDGGIRSARVILPIALKLSSAQSIVDVGCGEGSWLTVAREFGIEDYLGIDGDYVDRTKLLIPSDRFLTADFAKPLTIDRRFGLVLSTEVAEHLPESCADVFIESLTTLGDFILFSAAAPSQGGTDHQNEQWPSYWAKKFERLGFVAVDCIRMRVWDNADIKWWYAQNTILYVARDAVARAEMARTSLPKHDGAVASLVHPALFNMYVQRSKSVRGLLWAMPGALAAAWNRRRNRWKSRGE